MRHFCFALIILVTIGALHGTEGQRQKRVVGGKEAQPHSVPSQVILYQSRTSWTRFTLEPFCGGSLITELHVLTAAHCCDGKNDIVVGAGLHDIYDPIGKSRQKIPTYAPIMHPHYDAQRGENDICILHLMLPVQLSEHIAPAKLPTTAWPANNRAIAVGWGAENHLEEEMSPKLKLAELKILSDYECRHLTAVLRKSASGILCTLSTSETTCMGDSGGPLLSGEELIGVVSYGLATCQHYAVYAKVYDYKQWIISEINRTTGLVPRPGHGLNFTDDGSNSADDVSNSIDDSSNSIDDSLNSIDGNKCDDASAHCGAPAATHNTTDSSTTPAPIPSQTLSAPENYKAKLAGTT